MASPAHCYYCFESLSASFEGYDPIKLNVLEDLWEQHEQVKKLATLQDKNESVSLRENDNLSQPITEENDTQNNDDGAAGQSATKRNRPPAIKMPSINRLQSELSSDSSSASTTPSTNSVSSSSTAITTPGSQSDMAGSRRQKEEYREHPLFVTWNTVSKHGHKSLRGCIGTFEAQELAAGLNSYAITSAFHDTRFSPIPKSLLPSLSCSLTLLGSFEPCTNAMDWILGTHGIRISFIHRGRRYGATYLPDVPVEQGWTKEETVESLMRKAGWDGATGGVARRLLRGSNNSSSSSSGKPWDQVSDFRAVKYQGLKASADYAEWQEWRKWVLSLEDGEEMLFNSAR
ncbi:hypothetical protein ASPWEDRAFT_49142 [Aspergillus wentii DTO 134E9]|uniref:AMMECR1 domain-containing protein n=1 Tax=Aspergillus wentii DTO 134E9 TaxID=1073089 RepID=A0A1L9RW19_ASPWE|nr:uncharacterized protein ASPWEDRAFT_49142 [Aspergillus wentii DTO 134E9]KAI9929222.1 hypothetical protein MW887_001630 [Aspergillus wentii]OJJ39074.1 hypothetical protein ASPWEDRAFT_49142 [Aspergillus wentii DTO 134E9]